MKQKKESSQALLGKCPVCGHGNIIRNHGNYVCTEHFTNNDGKRRCSFCIPHNYYGVELNDTLIKGLIENGETDYLEMKLRSGIPLYGKIRAIKDKGLTVIPLKHYIKGAICPKCGGKILKTRTGYACENQVKKNQTCTFYFPNRLANRLISTDDFMSFLRGDQKILDGFRSNTNKSFSGYLMMNEDGGAFVSSRVGICPSCGGEIRVGECAFNCTNYSSEDGCKFSISRSYNGHAMTVKEVRELLDTGVVSFMCCDQYGHFFSTRLTLAKRNDIVEVKKEYYIDSEHAKEFMDNKDFSL